MPRSRRLLVEGGFYHVYNRCARGEDLFQRKWESERFLDLVRKRKELDGFSILAWCLMSNHYHLALRMGATPLSRSLRSIQGPFSQAFNILRERTGPVWQSRFQCRSVATNESLQRLILYIHLNPVRAGVVTDPSRYRMCGHGELFGRKRTTLIDVDDALLAFGTTRRSARRRYLSASRAAQEEDGGDVRLTASGWLEGDENLAPRTDVAEADLLGGSSGLEREALDAETFLRLCTEILDVPLHELASRRKGETLTRIREQIATVGIERWRQGSKVLGVVLGMHQDTIGKLAARGRQRAMGDPEFAGEVDDLDRLLAAKIGR